MTQTSKKIVVIDDDACNNHVFKIVVRHLCKPVLPEATCFTLPEEGVLHISQWLSANRQPLILFLDINMPKLTGWDVLDRLSLLPFAVREPLTIYMLSSSIDPADEQKANRHPLVECFIRKPIKPDMLWLKEKLISG